MRTINVENHKQALFHLKSHVFDRIDPVRIYIVGDAERLEQWDVLWHHDMVYMAPELFRLFDVTSGPESSESYDVVVDLSGSSEMQARLKIVVQTV
jgi:hypothetical protein